MSKICFFNTDQSWGGGIRYCIDAATALKARGHEVEAICSSAGELHQRYLSEGIHTKTIDVSNLSFLNIFKVFRLYKYFINSKTDVVLCTTSQDFKICAVAAKIAGVKKICYRRGLDRPIHDRWLNRFLLTKAVTHLIANSEATRRSMLHHLRDVLKEDRIKVIYNGIKKVNVPISPSPKKLILGNAGRMVPQKGQKDLIKVATSLKRSGVDFEMRIAGDGPLFKDLQEEIQSYGLENEVLLVGKITDINAFMQSIDLFLLTSRWEGFGYVIIEAGLHQKPIIAWDVSSNPELILHKSTGFLVPLGNIERMCKHVSLLYTDTQLRRTMGQNSAEHVLQHFTLNQSTDALVDFLGLN